MARTTRRNVKPVNPAIARIDRRIWPLAISIAYIILGLAYEFRWGPVVRHVPSSWIAPGDLLSDYGTAIQFAQGHFSNVYAPGRGFLSYPGLLVALAPLALLNGSFQGHWINVKVNGVVAAHPQVFVAPNLPSGFWYQGNLGPTTTHGIVQTIQPQAYPFLIFLTLLYSCFALFACDALAERLQVAKSRRAVLAVTEAVVLWNVTIIFGHPEDAVAVAFAIYALIFAMDERFVGAAWLFGLALAFQPLALVTFPILLAIAGRKRALGMAVRGVVPAAVVTAPPLLGSIHNTLHALITQPTFPDVSSAHRTPWTFLAPKLGGLERGPASVEACPESRLSWSPRLGGGGRGVSRRGRRCWCGRSRSLFRSGSTSKRSCTPTTSGRCSPSRSSLQREPHGGVSLRPSRLRFSRL